MDHVITGLDLITINSSQPISIYDVLNPLSALEYFFYRKGYYNFFNIIKNDLFIIKNLIIFEL